MPSLLSRDFSPNSYANINIFRTNALFVSFICENKRFAIDGNGIW